LPKCLFFDQKQACPFVIKNVAAILLLASDQAQSTN